MASFCATNGKSDPCTAMEKSTTTKTMWKRSFSILTGAITAMMANTTDAAPRNPAKDTSTLRARLPPKGAMSRKVASGRATRVRKTAMASAGASTSSMCDGNESSPNRKKSTACMMPVTPSKNGTRVRLSGRVLLPSTMPTMYTLKSPLPSTSIGSP